MRDDAFEGRAKAKIVKCAIRLYRRRAAFFENTPKFKKAVATDALCEFVNSMQGPVRDLDDKKRWKTERGTE